MNVFEIIRSFRLLTRLVFQSLCEAVYDVTYERFTVLFIICLKKLDTQQMFVHSFIFHR
jgi:hypothetical protein